GPPCPTERLVLQVPARALLEGDTVTLRCRGRKNLQVTQVWFYHEEKDLRGPLQGSELSLSPLQQRHGGRYRCEGLVGSRRVKSNSVTVTVHGEHPHTHTPI
ncbi:FCGR3 protein, partial [Pitta sordida]|nr:FCGR3 protein [Pitta sordida]